MKRPLAVFGAAFLAASLVGVLLPQQAQQPAAAFLLLSAVLLAAVKKASAGLRVVTAAGALALTWLCAYQAIFIDPVVACAGTESVMTGMITQVSESGYDFGQSAVVRIETLNGTTCSGQVSLRVDTLPGAEAGEIVSLTVTPEKTANDSYRYSRYADGIFLEADEVTSCTVIGHRDSLVLRLRAFREECAQNLRWLVHGDVGEIAAAMTVGDRSGLTKHTTDAFRRAGMSHVLVVSGLHLSMVSGFVYVFLHKRWNIRVASVAASAATLGFMLVVGLTPSVVRAGTAMLLTYAGQMFRRRSDALTSMGLSAALLCIQNPYASADVGLLLSYCAASTVVGVGICERRVLRAEKRRFGDAVPQLRRRALQFLFALAVPAATALTTMPILASIGTGVSVWSIPANLFAVPIAGDVVILGLLALAASFCPPLSFLADAFSFLCGFGIRALIWIAETAAAAPGGYFRFSKVTQTLPIVAAMLLLIVGMRWRIRKCLNALCAVLLAVVCIAVQTLAAADVVSVSVVGSGVSPSLVVVSHGEAAVVYRGTLRGAEDVAEWLEERGSPDVVLAVYLNEDAGTQDLEQLGETLGARACTNVSERLAAQPIRDTILVADTQKNGAYAMIDVGGYTVCIGTGTVDFTLLPRTDLFVAGLAAPTNLQADAVLALRPDADWLAACDARLYTSADSPELLVRPGRSAMIKGVNET